MLANVCSLFQSTCASHLPCLFSLTRHDRTEINGAALIFMAYPYLRRTRWPYFSPISYLHVNWQANEAYTFFPHVPNMLLLQWCYPSLNSNSCSPSFIDNGRLCEKCRTEQPRTKCAGNMKRRMIFGCASKSIKAF